MVQRLGGLAADIRGRAGAAPALVLLHGLSFDRSMWRPIIELLPADPERLVVAFDLPGHGDSEDQSNYHLNAVAATVHRAVAEAELGAPVVVGHSVSGLIATVYAAAYPARGVVNVDQPLDIGPFVELVRPLENRLRGPDFAELWGMFEASFHTELLSATAQRLVRSTTQPRQDLVLGYWSEIFELPTAALTAMVEDTLAVLREHEVDYMFVSGSAIDPDYEQWLKTRVPAAQVVSWPKSSHFPHLAHPGAFADILRQTADW